MNVLICDDEKEIVEAVAVYLESEGHLVFKTTDATNALQITTENDIHLALLDVMMPVMNGFALMKKIREKKNIPIILLTAKSEDSDKVIGLNLGADDYITKPFSPLELIARVNSQLRRYTNLGSVEKSDDVYFSGGLIVDDVKKEITVDGEVISLTAIQYKILLLLIKNKGRVFSMNEIYERVWNEEAINAENTIAVHIRKIREKIEINPKEPKYLKVVWGIGYKIEKI